MAAGHQSEGTLPESSPSSHQHESPDFLQDNTYQFNLLDFQVEGMHFRVPAYQFVQSGCLENMLGTSQKVGAPDREVIELTGVTQNDFKAFLKALYPLPYFGREQTLYQEEWIAVLKLSSQWDVIELKNAAVSALLSQDVSTVLKIQLGHLHDAPSLLATGKLELLEQREMISVTTAESLGIEVIHPILSARDLRLRSYASDHHFLYGPPGLGWGLLRGSAPSNEALDLAELAADSVSTEFEDVFSETDPFVDDVQLLILARESGVMTWLKAAYQMLVMREQFLTLVEAQKLDDRDVIGIARARETYMGKMKQPILSAKRWPNVERGQEKAAFQGYWEGPGWGSGPSCSRSPTASTETTKGWPESPHVVGGWGEGRH